jgi:hypothetical protein
MSNKVYPPSAAPEATREFRMTKFRNFFSSFGVHYSLFDILRFALGLLRIHEDTANPPAMTLFPLFGRL